MSSLPFRAGPPGRAQQEVAARAHPAPHPARWAAVALAAGTLLLSLSGCFTDKQNQGQKLYAEHCSSCHGEQGQGLARLIPPLAGADYLALHRAELPCLLRQGQRGPIKVNGILYNQVMPGHAELSPAKLTNLLNYIENSWGNKAPAPRTFREVEEQLQGCGGAGISH